MSSSKGKAKAAIETLLQQLNDAGYPTSFRLPTDKIQLRLILGRTLQSCIIKEDQEYDISKAFDVITKEYGKADKKRKKEGSAGDENKDNVEDEEESDKTPKKKKSKPALEFKVEANRPLVEALRELAGEEFSHEQKFKGMTLQKITKILREHDEEITSGAQAAKLKGIGKSTGKKIDQFLETGKIDRLEEYRAGTLLE